MFWLVFQTKVSIKRQLGSALIEHWMNLFIWVFLVTHVDHLLNVETLSLVGRYVLQIFIINMVSNNISILSLVSRYVLQTFVINIVPNSVYITF